MRPLEKEDIEQLRKWRNDPENSEFLSRVGYITRETQISWFERSLKEPDNLMFAVDFEGVFSGSMSLYNFTSDSVELGRILIGNPEAHGHKVAAKASEAIISVAFYKLGKESVYLHVFKNNIAAVKAYSGAGFKVIDEHINGGRPEYRMEIYRQDFKGKSANL